VLGIKRRIIAVGWNKTLTSFKENTFKQEVVAPSEWKGNIKIEHEEDILCAALMKSQPMFLATGSFDGEILIWNSVTEFACKHLTSRKRVMKMKEVFKV
jgi:WD40 repeat protein